MDDLEPDGIVLVRITLADRPGAVAYYLAHRDVAERLAVTAAPGDSAEVLDRSAFAVAAAVPASKIKRGRSPTRAVPRPPLPCPVRSSPLRTRGGMTTGNWYSPTVLPARPG
jgi:hypothetical protein